MSELDKNEFERWLASENGELALDTSILKNPEDVKYLRNRLWHAFHAGNCPLKMPLDSVALALFKQILTRNSLYLTKSIKRQITDYINNQP